MKTLCLLYEIVDAPEKREIIENAFSNRAVAGKYVELEPDNWLKRGKNPPCVPFGDPERHKDTDLPGVPSGCEGLSGYLRSLAA